MNKSHLILSVLVSFAFAVNLRADEAPKDDGFLSLLNGVDLKGWVGQTDGYQAQDDVLKALPRNRSRAIDLYRHQGRDFRLTNVHGNVAKEILA